MEEKNSHSDISITTESILRVVFIVVGLILLYLIRDILAVLLFAVIIAAAVGSPAGYLQKKGVPRTLAVFLIYLVAFGALIGLLYAVISPLSGELDNISLVVPVYFDRVQSAFKVFKDTAPQYEHVITAIQDRLIETSAYLARFADNVFGTTSKVFGGFVSAVFVIVISFYLAAQEHGVNLFLRTITPKEYQGYVLGLWARAQHKLGRWFQAQIVLSLMVGVLVYIGLAIFGVQHRVLLALIAAALEIIPFFGPILAAVPAVLLGLLKSPIVGLWVILIYTIVHQLENHLIVPNVMNRAVGLNPAVVIIALLIGGELYGLPGIMLSVPVAVILTELLKDFGHNHESV